MTDKKVGSSWGAGQVNGANVEHIWASLIRQSHEVSYQRPKGLLYVAGFICIEVLFKLQASHHGRLFVFRTTDKLGNHLFRYAPPDTKQKPFPTRCDEKAGATASIPAQLQG